MLSFGCECCRLFVTVAVCLCGVVFIVCFVLFVCLWVLLFVGCLSVSSFGCCCVVVCVVVCL